MSVRANVGLQVQTLLLLFVGFTLASAFEASTGRALQRAVRFVFVTVITVGWVLEPWLRALATLPDASHGEGFQKAARRLMLAALLAGGAVGGWITTAGRRSDVVWWIVVMVRDITFFMLMFEVAAVFAWSRMMRVLTPR